MKSRKVNRLFALYSELYDGEQVSLTLETDGSGQLSGWMTDTRILEWDDISEAIETLELWTGKPLPIIHCRMSAYYGGRPHCGKRNVEESRLTKDPAKVTCKSCLVSIAKKAREQCLNKETT